MGSVDQFTPLQAKRALVSSPFVRVIAMLTIVTTFACDKSEAILAEQLTDGSSVRDLLVPNVPNVVLFYEATTCFACGTPL